MVRRSLSVTTLGATLLRSISPATGALIGGLGVASPILAGTVVHMIVGRPSSTAGIAIPIALVLGLVGAAVGGILGTLARTAISRTRWAGPVDWRAVAVTLVLAIGIPSGLAIRSSLAYEAAYEAWNKPRVIVSSETIVRIKGSDQLELESPATLLWAIRPEIAKQNERRWNGGMVTVIFDDERMVLRVDAFTSTPLDLARFDYVSEVHAVPATLQGGNAEWLAVLVELRATSRREILAIFDPNGKLAYQELLERRTRLLNTPVLWNARKKGSERQHFLVNVGRPLSFRARP